MFPFQKNNGNQDYGAQDPYINPIIPDKIILGNFTEDHGFMGSGIDLIPSTSNQGERLISFGIQENEAKIRNDEVIDVKRFVHREIERQRRQEMANLCGSLKTLLPLEYVQGKRSMPEHFQGAVNYIKDMQSNIHQLKARRDNLKKSANLGFQTDNLTNCEITVNPCPKGVEILISTNIFEEEDQGFPLSRILRELLERGFNVISCFSTKADIRSLHAILLEASSPTLEDLSRLEERLTYVVNSLR